MLKHGSSRRSATTPAAQIHTLERCQAHLRRLHHLCAAAGAVALEMHLEKLEHASMEIVQER